MVNLVVKNAKIYTVDDDFSMAEAMAIHQGKIVFVGSLEDLSHEYAGKQVLDLEGKTVYPGFIDGHCHFLGYGRTLFDVDLVGTTSFDDVVKRTADFFGESPSGWVKGRGWDQNDWEDQTYPTKEIFDELYPSTPLVLRRVDGHAALVNSKALELAGISSETKVEGGEILKDENGELTGILIDNAVDLVMNIVPENIKERDKEAVQKAQANCFAVGLTSLADAGLPLEDVLFLKEEAASGRLKMRIYQMLSHNEASMDYLKRKGKYVSDNFTIKAMKCYMDGALGSRGALLNSPYSDNPHKAGLQLTSSESFNDLLKLAKKKKIQICTHAIGDRAVRLTLNAYSNYLKAGNDRRWRVEHSQVVDPTDIMKYAVFNIIPSIQPTHATSDMYWADERLGDRIATAYAYKNLLRQNGMVVSGSDFPVEGINPLLGFYAAVARKDTKSYPAEGFQMENALTRKEALKAMTIWAAYGQFEEEIKGSLEPGKWADFVVLDRDIMTVPKSEIFEAKVLRTHLAGKSVYKAIE